MTLPDTNAPHYWYERAKASEARIAELEAELAKVRDAGLTLSAKNATLETLTIPGLRFQIKELDAGINAYATMLMKFQPNRPPMTACPKCNRVMPECVGEMPCYYQEKRNAQS